MTSNKIEVVVFLPLSSTGFPSALKTFCVAPDARGQTSGRGNLTPSLLPLASEAELMVKPEGNLIEQGLARVHGVKNQ